MSETVNAIDLIVYLVLALAVWSGWRRGFILQLCSLAGVVAGIWLASRFGAQAGEWLNFDEQIRTPAGFVVVLLATLLVVTVFGYALRKLFHFAGFGLPDSLLGAAVSVAKYLLLLSVLFSAFDRLNEDYTLVGAQTVERSKLYKPIMHLSQVVLPFVEWVGEQVPPNEQE